MVRAVVIPWGSRDVTGPHEGKDAFGSWARVSVAGCPPAPPDRRSVVQSGTTAHGEPSRTDIDPMRGMNLWGDPRNGAIAFAGHPRSGPWDAWGSPGPQPVSGSPLGLVQGVAMRRAETRGPPRAVLDRRRLPSKRLRRSGPACQETGSRITGAAKPSGIPDEWALGMSDAGGAPSLADPHMGSRTPGFIFKGPVPRAQRPNRRRYIP